MGGVTRTPLFISVIVSELTDDLDVFPAIAIGSLVASWVGNTINKGLYAMLIDDGIKGYLPPEPPLSMEGKTVNDTMRSPVCYLPRMVCKADIIALLENTKLTHNGFPVVETLDSPVLVGIISRKKLERIAYLPGGNDEEDGYDFTGSTTATGTTAVVTASPISTNITSATPRQSTKMKLFNRLESHDSVIKMARLDHSEVQGIMTNIEIGDMGASPFEEITDHVNEEIMDLAEYMDTSPFSVPNTFSLTRAYRIFHKESLRHLIIVDRTTNAVVGIITRKDLKI